MRRLALFTAAAGAAGVLLARRRQGRRMSFLGKTVLITGGSRGLGLELARRFAAEGARLALLARSAEDLERARLDLARTGADVMTRPCDLRHREEAEAAVRETLDRFGRLDVLVNNAGVIQVGPAEQMELADFEETLDIHTWAPLHLMRAAVPAMRRQGGGRIVNIASVGGLVALPHMVPYSTSKFALVGLSDGMRAELAGDGILVTTVCPGLMRTGSHVNAFFKGQHEKEFAWFTLSNASPLLSTTSKKAARQIVEACRYGDARLTITPQARLLDLFNTVFPGMTAAGQKVTAALLPDPAGPGGTRRRRGWESRSAAAPSLLTRPADRAVAANNEMGSAE